MVLALATGALVVATNPGSHDRGNRFLTPTVAPGIEPHQRPASVEKRVLDALGTRRGFALIMAWWSLACAAHGLATGFGMLVASRLLLGIGEGGGFPAATKAVAEWFPIRERSTAMGIINAGTAVGAVVAPPAIALIIGAAGWRWVFFVVGAVGLAWTVWWLRAYFPAERHPKLSSDERLEIQDVFITTESKEGPISWFRLLTYVESWGLVLAKSLSDAGWYF